MKWSISVLERGWVPDPLIRMGIRALDRWRLRTERRSSPAERLQAKMDLVRQLRRSPVAVATDKANEQHYEMPPAFMEPVLGPHLKYSCCYWPPGVTFLAEAEEAALEQVCQRAGIAGAGTWRSSGGNRPVSTDLLGSLTSPPEDTVLIPSWRKWLYPKSYYEKEDYQDPNISHQLINARQYVQTLMEKYDDPQDYLDGKTLEWWSGGINWDSTPPTLRDRRGQEPRKPLD